MSIKKYKMAAISIYSLSSKMYIKKASPELQT